MAVTKEKPKTAARSPRRKRAISALSLAGETVSQWVVDFNNEVFHRARIIRINYCGKELFLALHSEEMSDCGASVDLRVGEIALRIGVESISSCALLDDRLKKMAFEVYPEEVQKILIESLFDPLLSTLEGWLCAPATVDGISFSRTNRRKSLPYHLSFHVYEKNPHENKNVPLVLSGSLHMDRSLMDRILDSIRPLEAVPYRHYEAAIPSAINAIASLEMSRGELDSLRVGDVILLENSNEIEMHIHEFIGIAPYRIRCRQKDDKMTVLSYERR
ncbi:MAG: hypothetical protein LBB38_02880 [Puniceicoccales bacterium]|nr:hypothetical protein [Puniceicoccales bacterium]